MKIQAFLPLLDEIDIFPWSLAHLLEQGIHVHVLDGWSTDGSYEWAEMCGAAGWVTVERFPDPDDGVWGCRRMLARIEELAAASDADFCMLNDADEFRVAPKDKTLAEAIRLEAAAGYNAIDHRVFSFCCTDADWDSANDPRQHFRYYDPNDLIAKLPQVKIWKRIPGVRVDLQSTGGHEARFPGRKVSRIKFDLLHYPYRTPEQTRRKLETRIARRCEPEHAAGWGVHYDAPFPPGFLWDPATLRQF